MTKSELKKLSRYTTLPVLLDLLKRKKIVLLDPATWEDKNDSEILKEYKKRKKCANLFALCFSYGDETIHHWKTFADGISGCCIEFDAQKLVDVFASHREIRSDVVRYRKMREVERASISVESIPFTKRWPYRCEEEFRVIWEGTHDSPFYEIEIDLRLIRRVTISQRMPAQVYETIREYLREAFQNPDKRINRSTIFENKIWIEKFRKH